MKTHMWPVVNKQQFLKELAAQQTEDESALQSHKKDIASHDRHRGQAGSS